MGGLLFAQALRCKGFLLLDQAFALTCGAIGCWAARGSWLRRCSNQPATTAVASKGSSPVSPARYSSVTGDAAMVSPLNMPQTTFAIACASTAGHVLPVVRRR